MDNIQTLNNYPDVLSPNDIMSILHIGRSTCYKLLYGGLIPSIRIGKQYRVLKKELVDYLSMAYANRTDGFPQKGV